MTAHCGDRQDPRFFYSVQEAYHSKIHPLHHRAVSMYTSLLPLPPASPPPPFASVCAPEGPVALARNHRGFHLSVYSEYRSKPSRRTHSQLLQKAHDCIVVVDRFYGFSAVSWSCTTPRFVRSVTVTVLDQNMFPKKTYDLILFQDFVSA